MYDLAVSIVAIFCLGSSVWAVFGHFNAAEMQPGAKVVSLFSLGSGAVLLVLVWLLPQPHLAAIVGVVVMVVAELLFWSAIRATRKANLLAAFAIENPHALVMTGPYRFIRHPFYTSYLLYWAGYSIATWTVWSIPLFVGLAVMYWRAAADEEAKFSRTGMAETYADYMRGTGRFFPRFTGRRA
ncbi:MAG: isoprenylcysteine carboxylmethyltransferase family protein [Oricola sp.]